MAVAGAPLSFSRVHSEEVAAAVVPAVDLAASVVVVPEAAVEQAAVGNDLSGDWLKTR